MTANHAIKMDAWMMHQVEANYAENYVTQTQWLVIYFSYYVISYHYAREQ